MTKLKQNSASSFCWFVSCVKQLDVKRFYGKQFEFSGTKSMKTQGNSRLSSAEATESVEVAAGKRKTTFHDNHRFSVL